MDVADEKIMLIRNHGKEGGKKSISHKSSQRAYGLITSGIFVLPLSVPKKFFLFLVGVNI